MKQLTIADLKQCHMDLRMHMRLDGGSLYIYACREHPAVQMSSGTGKHAGSNYAIGDVVIPLEPNGGHHQKVVDALNAYYAQQEEKPKDADTDLPRPEDGTPAPQDLEGKADGHQ